MEAVDQVLELIDRLRAKGFDPHADLGGGLGVAYKPGEQRLPLRASCRPCARKWLPGGSKF